MLKNVEITNKLYFFLFNFAAQMKIIANVEMDKRSGLNSTKSDLW